MKIYTLCENPALHGNWGLLLAVGDFKSMINHLAQHGTKGEEYQIVEWDSSGGEEYQIVKWTKFIFNDNTIHILEVHFGEAL
ncbi:hypothetical protein [Providencia phage PSTCR6]|nr:hypothetical protein [Providencia phage PSTCR6]